MGTEISKQEALKLLLGNQLCCVEDTQQLIDHVEHLNEEDYPLELKGKEDTEGHTFSSPSKEFIIANFARQMYIAEKGFYVITTEFLEIVESLTLKRKCIVDIGAGSGYYCKCLQQYFYGTCNNLDFDGRRIFAVDNYSYAHGTVQGKHFPITNTSATEALDKYDSANTLYLLIWPTNLISWQYWFDKLAKQPDAEFIYIGEDSGGASGEFNLDAFNQVMDFKVPRWDRMHDHGYVLKGRN